MSKPWIHAKSSARKWGGIPEDYLPIHELMDSSKSVTSLPSHRILTHQSWFISTILPRIFGEVFNRKSDGKPVSTRDIGEQHVAEDFKGFIPSASDFIDELNIQPWMMNGNGTPPSHAIITGKRKKPVSAQPAETTNTAPVVAESLFFDGRAVKADDYQHLDSRFTGSSAHYLDGSEAPEYPFPGAIKKNLRPGYLD